MFELYISIGKDDKPYLNTLRFKDVSTDLGANVILI
jgi:hypothetical protein